LPRLRQPDTLRAGDLFGHLTCACFTPTLGYQADGSF
jgi:hypothetical protein